MLTNTFFTGLVGGTMNTAEYCAALKRALKLPSDYALSKALRVSKQAVSKYVNGERVFDNTMAVRVAELLHLEPMKVIADCEIERGGDVDLWRRVSRKVAAVVVAVSAAAGAPDQASAFTNNGIVSPLVADATEIHIASHRRRRQRGAVLARLAAWLSACCALSFSL